MAAASDANCGTSRPRTFGRGSRPSSASVTTASVPSLPTISWCRPTAATAGLARPGRRTEHVEVVAAHAAQDAREAPADLVARSAARPGAPGDRCSPSSDARRPRRSHSAGGQRAERRPAAVGQHHVEPADVVDGLAVDDGARAGRVVADHAAEVGPAGGGHVRARTAGRARPGPG